MTKRKTTAKKSTRKKKQLSILNVPQVMYATINFRGNSFPYTYLCDIEGVQVGDHVVVDAPSSGLTVVEVVGVTDIPNKKATKWIISKVDLISYLRRLEAQKYKAALREELDKRRQMLDDKSRDDLYAKMDPEFARLLNEYRGVV